MVGDAHVFGFAAPLMTNQDVASWYALALIEDVRVGKRKHWCTEKSCMEVRADKVAALQLILRLKVTSDPMNQIARDRQTRRGHARSRGGVVNRTNPVPCDPFGGGPSRSKGRHLVDWW